MDSDRHVLRTIVDEKYHVRPNIHHYQEGEVDSVRQYKTREIRSTNCDNELSDHH